MRILFLTQWFQPENFFKGLPFAKAMKDKGHEVEVLTGFPNYPEGKLYSGYRLRFYQKEVMDGVLVHRVPLYPSHDKSPLRRMANYFSFSISTFLMGAWLVNKPDVIYVYNLVTLGPSAFFLRLLYGAKVIIDVQDLWPESVEESGMLRNKFILGILRNVCNWVYRRADHLTVLSPGFKNHLMNRHIASKNISVIYNWCDEIGMNKIISQPHIKMSHQMYNKFNILYAGTMGILQGLETLIKCAAICLEKMPDVQFLIIGDGTDRNRLEQLVADMKLSNVIFLPPRPIEEMSKIYNMADALFVHLKDVPLFRITIPSKTQAYLFIGKPIIMAMRGDAAELLHQSGAGIVCEPDSPESVAEAIKRLINMNIEERTKMGKAGYDFYVQYLSFNKGVSTFEDLMLSMR